MLSLVVGQSGGKAKPGGKRNLILRNHGTFSIVRAMAEAFGPHRATGARLPFPVSASS
ncbi:MAG: hypothetical protein LBO79_05255 [Zoogloeaceae bacterium]|jgi:hypothetical protein|nr:hypothetical protein [Zoogloeaceae bacterium]